MERRGWERGRRLSAAGVIVLATLAAAGCGGGDRGAATPAAPKRFPRPIFDGLHLGMSRAEAARAHPLRASLTAGGRNRRVWIYERPGDYSVELTFDETTPAADLTRIDVHFGPSGASPEEYVARFSRTLGAPDVVRRKATINAYGDQRHDQHDTIWSDATQYVYLTERVPVSGKGRPVYYLTVKKKEIAAAGPPTGYVPPPPPKGEDGKPVEEPIF